MRNPEPAAQIHALGVDVLDSLPCVDVRVEDRRVVGRHDAGVVVEHVYSAVALCRRLIHLLDASGVGHVHRNEESVETTRGGLLAGIRIDVGDANPSPLIGEHQGRLAADATGRSGDYAYLSVEPAHHPSVETNTFLTSE